MFGVVTRLIMVCLCASVINDKPSLLLNDSRALSYYKSWRGISAHSISLHPTFRSMRDSLMQRLQCASSNLALSVISKIGRHSIMPLPQQNAHYYRGQARRDRCTVFLGWDIKTWVLPSVPSPSPISKTMEPHPVRSWRLSRIHPKFEGWDERRKLLLPVGNE